jgi:hypothetical protein
MTLTEIRQYRHEAQKWKESHKAAQVILKLCDELERLHPIADERTAAFSDFSLMPFGAHKKVKLGDVPDNYLKWWLSQNPNADALSLDAEFGDFPKRMVARQKLKLFDYIQERFSTNGQNGH